MAKKNKVEVTVELREDIEVLREQILTLNECLGVLEAKIERLYNHIGIKNK